MADCRSTGLAIRRAYGLSESIRVAGGHKPVLSVSGDFADAADIRCDKRSSASERLAQDVRDSFGQASAARSGPQSDTSQAGCWGET